MADGTRRRIDANYGILQYVDTVNASPEFVDASDPRGPRLARRDWASGDLYFNAATHFTAYVAFFFQLAMLGVSFAFAAHLYHELVDGTYRAGDYGALLPIVVTGFLGVIMSKAGILPIIQGLKWRDSLFHLVAVPVPLGGPLRGQLRTSGRIAAGHKVWFKLECVSGVRRRYKSGGTTDVDTSYNTIWEDEEAVVSDGSGIIPIAFVIPADARPSRAWSNVWIAPDQDWTIEWRLTAQESGDGIEGYFGEFDLPVFSIPVTAEQKAEVESIRAGRTTELREYKPGPDFKVRITPTGDGGTEFFIPPVRGAANAIFQTLVFVVTLSLLVPFLLNGQPSMAYFAVAGGWGAIELAFFTWILRPWFAPEQVVVANGILSDTYGIFGRTRTMTTAEITSIRVTKGDYTRHYAIRIVGAGLHLFTVGDGIRQKRDAEWLAQQMSQAAGVKAADSIPVSSEIELAENLKAVEAAPVRTRGPLSNAMFIGLLMTIGALAGWIYKAMVINGHWHGH